MQNNEKYLEDANKMIDKIAGISIDNERTVSNIPSVERAKNHKDKLLEYDRTSEKRTKVIDDESDYFSTDALKWMPRKQKDNMIKLEQELREKQDEARRSREIDFDFSGKRVTESKTDFSNFALTEHKLLQSIKEYNTERSQCEEEPDEYHLQSNNSSLANPCLSFEPKLDESYSSAIIMSDKRKQVNKSKTENEPLRQNRLQGNELQEMSD